MGFVIGKLSDVMQSHLPHAGQVGHNRCANQSLAGADVGGGPLTANVLLPGLQGKNIAIPSLGIHRFPDDTAWHLSKKLSFTSK